MYLGSGKTQIFYLYIFVSFVICDQMLLYIGSGTSQNIQIFFMIET